MPPAAMAENMTVRKSAVADCRRVSQLFPLLSNSGRPIIYRPYLYLLAYCGTQVYSISFVRLSTHEYADTVRQYPWDFTNDYT